MVNQITTILFDFDDTLYPFEQCECNTLEIVFAQLQKRIGEEVFEGFEDFKECYKATRKKVDNDLCMGFLNGLKVKGSELIQAGSHNRTVIFKRLLKDRLGEVGNTFGIVRLSHDLGKLYETLFVQHMMDAYDTKVTDFLYKLREEKKYSLGLVTNYTLSSQLRKLRKLGIERYFGTIVTSEESGADKPDPRIFCRALEDLGVAKQPMQAVMVGDSDTDIAGANNVGLWTIKYKQSDKEEECRKERRNLRQAVADKKAWQDTCIALKQKTVEKMAVGGEMPIPKEEDAVKEWEKLVQADAIVCHQQELEQLLADLRKLSPESAFSNFRSEY